MFEGIFIKSTSIIQIEKDDRTPTTAFFIPRKGPEALFTRYSIAYEFLRQGDLVEAEKHFNILKENDPDYVGLYYHLGKLHVMQESYDRAVTIYEEGLKVAEKVGDTHAHSELVRARQQAQDELEEW